MSGRTFGTISSILATALLYFGFQNCMGGDGNMNFAKARESLASYETQGGGSGYDGKPELGSYCRVFDELTCQTQIDGLQSLLKVDQSGLHLEQDNCATTSTNFLFGDVAVKFTSLLPDYIGVSRGIFKKCDPNQTPNEMPDAYCVANHQNFAAVINRDLSSSTLNLAVAYDSGNGLRTVTANSIIKSVTADGDILYSSRINEFDLSIKTSNSQTADGKIQIAVDDKILAMDLNCSTSNPKPTIIIEDDMELSPTWIDTSQLVGYWKLNEPNAVEGTSIVDSSPFASNGILLTGNDGLNKSDMSAKGGAISLDGLGDSVRVSRPTDDHLEFGTRSFSYMIWIQKTGSRSSFDMPFYHGGAREIDGGFDFECGTFCRAYISDGLGVMGSSSAMVQLVDDTTSWLNSWILIVAVVDRSNQQMRAYVDGNLVGTTNISSVGPVISDDEIRFGGIADGRHPFWGSIDDAAIWNRALTSAEILEIFQRLRPKFR